MFGHTRRPRPGRRLVHGPTGAALAERLLVPRTVFGRGAGLMLRRALAEGEGMWIDPCNGIHMFFMRFPIDAVFLDRRLRVVRVVHRLRPWRIVPLVVGARSVVELPAGTARAVGLAVGERVEVQETG